MSTISLLEQEKRDLTQKLVSFQNFTSQEEKEEKIRSNVRTPIVMTQDDQLSENIQSPSYSEKSTQTDTIQIEEKNELNGNENQNQHQDKDKDKNESGNYEEIENGSSYKPLPQEIFETLKNENEIQKRKIEEMELENREIRNVMESQIQDLLQDLNSSNQALYDSRFSLGEVFDNSPQKEIKSLKQVLLELRLAIEKSKKENDTLRSKIQNQGQSHGQELLQNDRTRVYFLEQENVQLQKEVELATLSLNHALFSEKEKRVPRSTTIIDAHSQTEAFEDLQFLGENENLNSIQHETKNQLELQSQMIDENISQKEKERERENFKMDSTFEDLVQLQTRNLEMKNQIMKLNNQYQELEKHNIELKTQLHSSHQKIVFLEENDAQAREREKEKDKTNLELKQKNNLTKGHIEQSPQITDLEAQILELTQKKTKDEIKNLKNQVMYLETNCEEYSKTIENLQKELLEKELTSRKTVWKLESEMSLLQDKLQDLQKTIISQNELEKQAKYSLTSLAHEEILLKNENIQFRNLLIGLESKIQNLIEDKHVEISLFYFILFYIIYFSF